jgi:hypothetical protein
MIQEQAQQLIKEAQQKRKDLETSLEDAQYKFRQECEKAQRTIQVIFYQTSAACDNFYESIHEGFQCVHDAVTSTDGDKAVALKNRCVMVNDWNTGVMNKRSRIEVQTRGDPIQSYEAKLPGKPSSHKQPNVDDHLASFLEGFEDERSLPEQDLKDIDLRNSESDEGRDDDDDIYENVSSSKYWYTQNVTRKTLPGQVENEVIVRKKTKKSNFFGGDGQQETLDQLIGVFKRKLQGYNMTE